MAWDPAEHQTITLFVETKYLGTGFELGRHVTLKESGQI
jgi:hypothetical protein